MAVSGLRKFRRKDKVQASAIKRMPELHGSIFVYGRIGGGKSVSLLSIAQAYHDHPERKYKVFDFWGGDRNENLHWTLPSTKLNYWKHLQKSLKLDKIGIRQYRVNLLYPMIGNIPRKLPNNEFVKSKIFTIPFESLTLKDFPLIMGAMSTRDESLWTELLYICKGKSVAFMIDKTKRLKAQKYNIYKRVLRPLYNSSLIQSEICNNNIDIVSELDDQETITVLCLDFVPEEFRVFIVGYLIRRISEEIKNKRRKTLMLLREVHQFFRVTDSSIVPERIKIFKTYLAHWIKMGRSGIHFILDTQSPSETRGIAEGQQDTTFLGRLPSQADRQSATEQLMKDNLITPGQVTRIGVLNPGQFIVCPSGERAYSQYFFLPKSRFWEEGDGNFYSHIWKREKDEWMQTKPILSNLLETKELENEEITNEKAKVESKFLGKLKDHAHKDEDDIKKPDEDEELEEESSEEEKKQQNIDKKELKKIAKEDYKEEIRQKNYSEDFFDIV